MRSFVVPLWAFVFKSLGVLSPHYWVIKLVPHDRRGHGFTDLWVIAHFHFAAIWLYLAGNPMTWQRWAFAFYGALRVGEILVHQCKVVLLEAGQGDGESRRNHVRTMILSLYGYFEVILWFAGVYRCTKHWFTKPEILATWDGALYHSVMTVSTLGFGDIAPVTLHGGGRLLTALHIVVSLFLNLVVLTRLIANLPVKQHHDE